MPPAAALMTCDVDSRSAGWLITLHFFMTSYEREKCSLGVFQYQVDDEYQVGMAPVCQLANMAAGQPAPLQLRQALK